MTTKNTLLAIPGIAALLLLAACNSNGNTVDDTSSSTSSSSVSSSAMMDDHDMDEDGNGGQMDDGTSSSAAQTSSSDTAADADARVITMSVTDFNFAPNAITAKKGEKVVVRLTDIDGIHSFGAMDLGLNVRIGPGETKDIVIPTDKTGTFSFRCLVPCGPGHKDMVGTITIS